MHNKSVLARVNQFGICLRKPDKYSILKLEIMFLPTVLKINLTLRMLDSAPVLCPTPEEPTLSRSCLPQSERDEKNVLNSEFI